MNARLRKSLAMTVSSAMLLAAITPAFAEPLAELVSAAKKEGQLTTIALPHDWCGYGAVIDGFKAMGSATDLITADIRAAKDLHYNTQEYLWVKGQILTASTSVLTEKITAASGAAMDQVYASTLGRHAETAGLNYWQGVLQQTGSPSAVV